MAINTTVYNLISMTTGYACNYVTSVDLISGGPGWIKTDLFDVRAAIPSGGSRVALGSPELQVMIRSMLEDRFRMVMRREIRERSFYELKMGDGPLKLKEWNVGDKMEYNGQLLSAGRSPLGTYLGIYWVPDPIGGDSYVLLGRNVTMSGLADWAALAIYRPVVDRTGLPGKYSFDVEYSKDGLAKPTLPTAIREQLGLRLEETKGPNEIFVIDQIEKPSEN